MAASVTHKPKGAALLTGTEYEAADAHTVSITAADVGAAATAHSHAGEDITSGTVADGRVASTIARDSEVTTAVSDHAAAADPHTGYRLESADHSHATTGLQGGTVAHLVLTGITATDHHAAPAAGPDANVTVDSAGPAGTASTFARSGHGHQVVTDTGVASTQAFGDAATAGTSGSVQRGSHKHAMPALGYGLSGNGTAVVGLTTASAFATATTSVSAATYADVTGVSISLAAGTWLIEAQCTGSSVNAQAIMHVAITDGANAIVSEGSQGIGASGTASVAQLGTVGVRALVSPVGTATYKMRAARGLTTITGTWVAMDGAGTNTTNNLTDNSDKGTGIFAVRIA